MLDADVFVIADISLRTHFIYCAAFRTSVKVGGRDSTRMEIEVYFRRLMSR